jgi:hypothetical protein
MTVTTYEEWCERAAESPRATSCSSTGRSRAGPAIGEVNVSALASHCLMPPKGAAALESALELLLADLLSPENAEGSGR